MSFEAIIAAKEVRVKEISEFARSCTTPNGIVANREY